MALLTLSQFLSSCALRLVFWSLQSHLLLAEGGSRADTVGGGVIADEVERGEYEFIEE